MLNIQSLIKFPIPQVTCDLEKLSDGEADKHIYNTYGFAKDEISYIEEQI